jgi:hypothetical protein
MDFKLLILFILKILEDLNKWWRGCSGLKFTILYVKKWESRGTGNDVGIYVRLGALLLTRPQEEELSGSVQFPNSSEHASSRHYYTVKALRPLAYGLACACYNPGARLPPYALTPGCFGAVNFGN